MARAVGAAEVFMTTRPGLVPAITARAIPCFARLPANGCARVSIWQFDLHTITGNTFSSPH